MTYTQSPSSVVPKEDDSLCEYELLRLNNIKERNRMLESIGLEPLSSVKSNPPKKVRPKPPNQPVRYSERIFAKKKRERRARNSVAAADGELQVLSETMKTKRRGKGIDDKKLLEVYNLTADVSQERTVRKETAATSE